MEPSQSPCKGVTDILLLQGSFDHNLPQSIHSWQVWLASEPVFFHTSVPAGARWRHRQVLFPFGCPLVCELRRRRPVSFPLVPPSEASRPRFWERVSTTLRSPASGHSGNEAGERKPHLDGDQNYENWPLSLLPTLMLAETRRIPSLVDPIYRRLFKSYPWILGMLTSQY